MTGPFAEVLAHYPEPIRTVEWFRLESSGGLSGAAIWRGDRNRQPLVAAKCYPSEIDPADVARRHVWCAAAVRAGLSFVPGTLSASDARTVVVRAGRCWELATWMPGEADFEARPSRVKLLGACDAVIDLLEAWRGFGVCMAALLAVSNRLNLFAEWERRPLSETPISEALLHRASAVLAAHLPGAIASLAPWAERKLPCQPCVRDLRREHFLFTGDALTGLIDYGAAAWDTPATDAARMLGELAGGDAELYGLGLARFAERLGPAVCPSELVRVLDHTGVVGSIIRWLLRLQRGELPKAPIGDIGMRLERLVGRLEAAPATWSAAPVFD